MATQQALICILLALFSPPLGMIVSLVFVRNDFRSWRVYIAIIAFAMGIFAYYYEPTIECDLTRYYEFVESMIGHTYLESLEIADRIGLVGHDPLYSFIALCWGVALTGNARFLPMISTASVYYIGMYITCRYSEDLADDEQDAARYLCFILLAVNFFSIVNNVRNMLSFSLIILAVFRDCHLKKRNLLTVAIYAAGIFMHLSGIVLILFRFFVPVFRKAKTPVLIIGLIIPNIVVRLTPVLRRIDTRNVLARRVIDLFISGNSYYTHTDADWAITVASSGAQRLFKILYLSLAAAIVVLYYCYNHALEKEDCTELREQGTKGSMIDFSYYCSVLALACAPMVMPEYWRFGCSAILCGAGLFVLLPVYLKSYGKTVQHGFFVFGFCMFALWFRNLWMYSNVPIGVARSLLFGPLPSLFLAPFEMTAFSLL